MIPFIILLFFSGLSLGITAVKHGEPREDYNFVTTFISLAIEWTLIYFMCRSGIFYAG